MLKVEFVLGQMLRNMGILHGPLYAFFFFLKGHDGFRDSQVRSLVFIIALLEILIGRDCIRYCIYFHLRHL